MTMRHLTAALACAGLFAFAACHDSQDDDPQQPIGFHPVAKGPKSSPTPSTQLPPDNADTATADSTPPPAPRPSAPDGGPSGSTVPQTPVKSDYPYGLPVEGKPGFVTSPYAPESGYVDVHGFAPGQEVRDPYTKKIFLVP